MYYIKRIIITSEGKDGEKVISELDLKPGLNIVYGPSNTGKTHVLDCIDFMLGGDAKRLYKKELKIKAVSMFIDSDGAELTMYRELAEETKSDIVVSSKIAGIAPGTYTANNQPTKEKDTIGSLWLKLMGIHEEVKIIKQIEDAQWQRLTVRTFYHMFVINENRISGENSILKSGTTWTNNIPVPTITSLIYLLTEKNYIAPGEKQQTPKATVKIKRAAAKQIVDGSMEAIKEKESLGIQEEETLSASDIQQEINNLLEEISAAEDSLKQTTEHDEEISELIIGLTKSISESTVLKGRYDALRTRYEADMRRLTFIAEADLHKDSIPKIERCPFCNGELPKEKTQSCLDAAIAEADKIELRIKDLQSADEALTYEIDRLQRRRDGYVREQQQVQSSIRGELRPQVDALRERLVRYTVALERAKAKEMVRYFSEVLNDQLLKLHNEDGDFALNFDVRAKIREELQKPMEKLLTEILKKCKYENYVGSRFAGWNGKVDNLPLFEYDEASGTGYAYTYEVTEIKVGSEPVDINNPPENYNGQNSDYLVTWTQDPDDPKHWILGNQEKQGIDVTVKKVALWDVENSAAVPLEGATFKLEKYTDSTYTSKDTSFKDVTIEDKDNETKGLFSFENLHEGYYKLVETKTPKDFIKTSSDPRFRVKKDSSNKLIVVLIDEEGQEIEGKGSSPVIVENTTITVGNDKGFALPQTGGSGTDLIYLTGILLIGLCGVLLLRRRFRRI